jgi:ATP-dependent RNA helicase RhlE
LSSVQILVLDEADRMLDLGFVHALKRIVKLLPRPRQTLLFSATMPRAIAVLAEDYLDNPVKVVVAPAATTAERIDQGVVFVSNDRKRELLVAMLRNPALARVLVFTRTKHGADRVVRHLAAARIKAAVIHGNKSQPQRERALTGFRDGQARVLVATDIAARGIDVDGVSHVINFELPNVPEDYVHRIGRTARAGAAGIAIAFCSDDERPYLRDIEKLTRSSLHRISAPAAFVRGGSLEQPVEAALSKRTPQPPVHSKTDPDHRPRKAPTGAIRVGSFPGPSALAANSARRGSDRRGTPAARFNSAR